MEKKITREQFSSIAMDAIKDEIEQIANLQGGGSAMLLIMATGTSIVHRVQDKLFGGDTDTLVIEKEEKE